MTPGRIDKRRRLVNFATQGWKEAAAHPQTGLTMLAGSIFRQLITLGRLTVIDAHGVPHVFGGQAPGPSATIRLHDAKLHRQLAFKPTLAFGEAYVDGTLTIEEGTLHDVLDLLCRNLSYLEEHPLTGLHGRLNNSLRWLQAFNPLGRARRNVAHHYDLSDTLYDLFLDADRQYSCAYFRSDNDSLEVAQDNKKLHLASKLLLQPGQKVLDIGSGWGGLGLYLAKLAGVDVTGVTLSVEQQKYSQARAAREGLSERVRFALRDYRQESGRYDRIISVGMFEHVGVGHYRAFFTKLRDLLADDGVAVLHSIGRMEPPSATNPWIRKYIFPGGYIPALSEVMRAVESVGLWITDMEVLRLHYAATLQEWHRRFQANRERVRALYDERFCRMWEFYLVGCEMSFRYLRQMNFQLQISRRIDAVPLTRDYMVDFEREHLRTATLAA